MMNRHSDDDLEGARVLILKGHSAGNEGVCLGRAADGKSWAISPDQSGEILMLQFRKDFGLVIDLSSDPHKN
jgi:hypothetical protein